MARIQQILRLARQTLGDKDGDRWTDTDLLDLLNAGHKDICHHAKILRGEYVFSPEVGQATYILPDDVFLILRADVNGCKLALHTFDHMDEEVRSQYVSTPHILEGSSQFGDPNLSYCWMAETGAEPSAIIYDKSNLNEIRLYPIPNDAIVTEEMQTNSIYGVVSGFTSYVTNNLYGASTGVSSPDVTINFDDEYGVLSDAYEVGLKIYIRYIKTPEDIVAIDDTQLKTPRAFDMALKFYIVGMALRNDLDTRNVARGNQEMEFYLRELGLAMEVSSKNGSRQAVRSTSYRTAFE